MGLGVQNGSRETINSQLIKVKRDEGVKRCQWVFKREYNCLEETIEDNEVQDKSRIRKKNDKKGHKTRLIKPNPQNILKSLHTSIHLCNES